MARGGKRAGAGRPKNTPNKATRDIKATAATYTVEAVHELAKLAGLTSGNPGAESEQARISALKELLDRGHGRPTHSVDVSFPDVPSVDQMTDEQLMAIIVAGGGIEKQSKNINGHASPVVTGGKQQRGEK
jgi:hypothetical protein